VYPLERLRILASQTGVIAIFALLAGCKDTPVQQAMKDLPCYDGWDLGTLYAGPGGERFEPSSSYIWKASLEAQQFVSGKLPRDRQIGCFMRYRAENEKHPPGQFHVLSVDSHARSHFDEFRIVGDTFEYLGETGELYDLR
jgi:hypothetical protein